MSVELKREIEGIEIFGYEFIIPGRKEEWKVFCEAQESPLSVSMARQVLEVMVLISKGDSYDHIVTYSGSRMNHSGNSWAWILYQVARFHPQGVEFARKCGDGAIMRSLEPDLLLFEEENKTLLNSSVHKK